MSLRLRNRFFRLSGKTTRIGLKALNRSLATLSRVVIHPVYRGAGLASSFVRQSCLTARWPWIEALAQMGHLNPFFEKAGFIRVGVVRHRQARDRRSHSAIYGASRRHGFQRLLSQETHQKSRYAEPVYYVFDNRNSAERPVRCERRSRPVAFPADSAGSRRSDRGEEATQSR